MQNKPHIGRRSVVPHYVEAGVDAIDLACYTPLGDGGFRAVNHVPADSEYEPALDRWSDLRVPARRHMALPER